MKALLLKDLAKAKDYTMKVVEAMPEDQFDFKPTDTVWSFRELIHHMAYAMLWIDENYLLKTETAWTPPAVHTSKKELIGYLSDSFDAAAGDIQKTDATDDSFVVSFYFMIEHNAHHRGQAVTYLRCCGITPPVFPF